MASFNTKASPPLQVIACGLPRTGTTTTGEALATLLQSPVFDGGGESFYGSAKRQRLLIELFERCPIRTITDKMFVLYRLAELTEGFVASTDLPGCYFIEELLQLYPDAKVICTVRDRESWWASYTTLWQSIRELDTLSWLSPTLYRFCKFSLRGIWRRVPQSVGIPDGPVWPMTNHEQLYEAHAEYVRRVVPPDKLHYFDVKDGWGPLCKILNVPVPDQPFPHAFPRSYLVGAKTKLIARLRLRLACLVGITGVLGSVLGFACWRYAMRRIAGAKVNV